MGSDVSGLSYSKGEQFPALLDLCIGQVLERTAQRFPDNPGLIVRQSADRFTWNELNDRVTTVSRALMAIGVKKGDRVAMWATNITEWVLIQFATARIGAILVNINLRYRAHELEFALRQSECQTLVLIHGFRDCDYVETLYSIAPELKKCSPGKVHCKALPNLRNLIFVGDNAPECTLPWNAFLAKACETPVEELRQREAALAPKDAINIQYTSGTTGAPKGATLTHYGVVNNGLFIGNSMKMTAEDRVCIPVPFYHCFGMVLGNMTCLVSGAAMVIPADSFDPLETLRCVEEERCTALYGVPTMFIAELDHPEFKNFDLRSLRTGIMAGSVCPIELMKRVTEEMHCHDLTNCYGLTEASPVITQTTTEDTFQRKVTTIGRALPHTEVKLVDTKTGAVVPRGAVGELMTRGYLLMKGYYNDPKSTAATIEPDGWLHTGDLATMDDDGYFRITGRIKEMIIRGGENIYPREIEDFLHTCPGIANVQVIGIPDPKYGEEVMAWVQLKRGANLTAQDIRDFCKGKISNFKIPRHIRFVDDFPMTVSGKVQKFKMREISVAELAPV